MPRFKNDIADALTKLTASVTLPDEREIQIIIEKHHLLASALNLFYETKETNVISIFEAEKEVN